MTGCPQSCDPGLRGRRCPGARIPPRACGRGCCAKPRAMWRRPCGGLIWQSKGCLRAIARRSGARVIRPAHSLIHVQWGRRQGAGHAVPECGRGRRHHPPCGGAHAPAPGPAVLAAWNCARPRCRFPASCGGPARGRSFRQILTSRPRRSVLRRLSDPSAMLRPGGLRLPSAHSDRRRGRPPALSPHLRRTGCR